MSDKKDCCIGGDFGPEGGHSATCPNALAPMDELGERRDNRRIAKAINEMNEAVVEGVQSNLKAFADWARKNMPLEAFVPMLGSIVESTIGSYIGAWMDAGATPEQLKEYLGRFVDIVYEHGKLAKGR